MKASHPRSTKTPSGDSDFSHMFSWSTSLQTSKGQKSSLYRQSIPSDILRVDDLETVSDITLAMAAVFDPTTLDIEFDYSCLDGLDDQTLYFPINAFAAVCWAEAVHELTCPSYDPIPNDASAAPIKREERSFISSDESISDSDECHTFNDDLLSLSSLKDCDIFDDYGIQIHPVITKDPSFDPTFEQMLSLESRCTRPDSKESIGLFPMPRKVKTSRFAIFHNYLPTMYHKKSGFNF